MDPALVGRRVELRYDPEDLSGIDVYFEGKPGRRGDAVRHRTPYPPGRPPGETPEPEPTGVDYLGMVAAAHEEARGHREHRLLPAGHVRATDETEAEVSRAPRG